VRRSTEKNRPYRSHSVSSRHRHQLPVTPCVLGNIHWRRLGFRSRDSLATLVLASSTPAVSSVGVGMAFTAKHTSPHPSLSPIDQAVNTLLALRLLILHSYGPPWHISKTHTCCSPTLCIALPRCDARLHFVRCHHLAIVPHFLLPYATILLGSLIDPSLPSSAPCVDPSNTVSSHPTSYFLLYIFTSFCSLDFRYACNWI
jgi:hypothetical protein